MSINKIDLNSAEYKNNSVSEEQLVLDIFDFYKTHKTRNSLFLAHNVKFDQKFLFHVINTYSKINQFEDVKFLCTVRYFQKVIGLDLIKTVELTNAKGLKYNSSKLEHIMFALNLKFKPHNALEDTLGLIESYKMALRLDRGMDQFELFI